MESRLRDKITFIGLKVNTQVKKKVLNIKKNIYKFIIKIKRWCLFSKTKFNRTSAIDQKYLHLNYVTLKSTKENIKNS